MAAEITFSKAQRQTIFFLCKDLMNKRALGRNCVARNGWDDSLGKVKRAEILHSQARDISMPINLRTKLNCFVLLLGLSTLLTSQSKAEFIVTLPGNAHVINFDGFTGAGFSPTPGAGQLNSNTWAVTGMSDGNLAFGGTGTSGDFARGASLGGVTTGGIYSFNTGSGNTASLGVQPGGSDFNPGTLTLRLLNNIGQAISSLDLSYDVFVRNDQGRANSFNFSYSTNNINYVELPALDLTSPAAADSTPAWVSNNRVATISGLNIADGTNFYFRWTGDDVSGSNNRDEFALDNISVTPYSAAVPEPTSLAMVGIGCIMLARRRRR